MARAKALRLVTIAVLVLTVILITMPRHARSPFSDMVLSHKNSINRRQTRPGLVEGGVPVGIRSPSPAKIPKLRDFHVIQADAIDSNGRRLDDVTRVLSAMGPPTEQSLRPTKTILLWNASSGEPLKFGFGMGIEPFVRHGCVVSACHITSDRSALPTADVVLINTRKSTTLFEADPFPKRAHSKQLMAFYNIEAPLRILNQLQTNSHFFNLTMTHRLDSDIPIRHVTMWPRPASEPYVPLTAADMATKNKTVMWIISHCDKSGTKRWEYVQELSQYINVDIFGACGKPGCPRTGKGQKRCVALAKRKYKFYLSLENAQCKDYVTEKLKNPLKWNLVPIVHGGLDYDAELPPTTVIKLRLLVSEGPGRVPEVS